MGYYTGNGVRSNGGSAVNVYASGIDAGGLYTIYQRATSATTRKSGVSLNTATSESADCDMRSHTWPGGAISFSCKGTKKHVSYNQISGSNLYELTIVNETIQVKLNDGSWNS